MSETWLILGASSAIGRAFAREAARRGADIILAGRDADDLARSAADIGISSGREVSVAAFDACDSASHVALAARLAGLPGLVNVALLFGIMPEQAAMDDDVRQALSCIETGFVGAVSVLHRLAPELGAAAGRGHCGIRVGGGRSRPAEELRVWCGQGGAAHLSGRLTQPAGAESGCM